MVRVEIGQKRKWFESERIFTVKSHVANSNYMVCEYENGYVTDYDLSMIESYSYKLDEGKEIPGIIYENYDDLVICGFDHEDAERTLESLRIHNKKIEELYYLFKEWNKSKHKHYYRVSMYNGGSKIVMMCEEQIKYLCTVAGNHSYERIG